MSVFGWSYPPGCNGTLYDEDYPCEVCGLFPDDCICLECPQCDVVGDPECYEQHGMVRSAEQIQSLAREQAKWEADNAAGTEYS